MLIVDQDSVPVSLASYSWITYINFTLMFVFAAAIGFGIMAPLQRIVRRILSGLFLVTAAVNLASIILVLALLGLPMDVVPTTLNVIFCTSIGVGMILGYESKAASFLLPFRRDGVEEELDSVSA